MSHQAKNEFYRDEEELVMGYAAAVNAELRDPKAAGADVIQLDEPCLQARSAGGGWISFGIPGKSDWVAGH